MAEEAVWQWEVEGKWLVKEVWGWCGQQEVGWWCGQQVVWWWRGQQVVWW